MERAFDCFGFRVVIGVPITALVPVYSYAAPLRASFNRNTLPQVGSQ